MIVLMLCYHSIVPSTCKDDISASATWYLLWFNLVNWCIGRPTLVSSCCFGGLSCNSLFYFAASWVQSMTKVIDCTHAHSLLSSCDLFLRLERLCG